MGKYWKLEEKRDGKEGIAKAFKEVEEVTKTEFFSLKGFDAVIENFDVGVGGAENEVVQNITIPVLESFFEVSKFGMSVCVTV